MSSTRARGDERRSEGVVSPLLVIFDLDGTLADSQAGVLHSFSLTLADDGRTEPASVLRDLIGPPLSESFARLGYIGAAIDDAVARYRGYYDREGVAMSRLYDGTFDVLRALSDEGTALAVATSKRVDFAQRMLRTLGIDDYFPVICGAALDGTLNTKREVLGAALDLLTPVSPERTWMVGDRREDMQAALFHSLVPIGALWGYGSPEELSDSGAQLLVSDPSALLAST